MLTVEDYGRIRRAHRDGMSIREIARRFHHSRRKIREILRRGQVEPQKYTTRVRQGAPKLGAFHGIIDGILQQDEDAPPKQRHTAMRIFERLRDEQGYQGGYDAVRRFVKKHRQEQRETFIPLAHDAVQRMEADFGEIAVDFPDGRCKVSVLILSWSYSNAAFAIALPTQRTEAILAGMCEGFEFFGCVPLEVWWDNPTTVATAILTGRERKLNERYAALASHFTFDPLFCMPASGNEKPSVENRVKTLQRRWGTPVPRVEGMNELNAYLRQRCLAEMSRTCQGKSATIGERFQAEKAAALALPSRTFEACVRAEANVDKYQFARLDNVCYSVPRRCAFQTVTVKGFVDRVEIVHQNTVVATHVRSYSYDFSACPSVNKQRVLELGRCDWISRRKNVCLLGQPGTGKTHLAVALGLSACRAGMRTKFVTAAALVNQLEAAQQHFGLDRLLKRLDKLDLLIVDELGYLSFGRSAAELLFQVFAERYERRSLLITSNLAFGD